MAVDPNCYKTQISIRREIPFQNLRCTEENQIRFLGRLNKKIKDIVDAELKRIKTTYGGRRNAAGEYKRFDQDALDTVEVAHESRFKWHEDKQFCVVRTYVTIPANEDNLFKVHHLLFILRKIFFFYKMDVSNPAGLSFLLNYADNFERERGRGYFQFYLSSKSNYGFRFNSVYYKWTIVAREVAELRDEKFYVRLFNAEQCQYHEYRGATTGRGESEWRVERYRNEMLIIWATYKTNYQLDVENNIIVYTGFANVKIPAKLINLA